MRVNMIGSYAVLALLAGGLGCKNDKPGSEASGAKDSTEYRDTAGASSAHDTGMTNPSSSEAARADSVKRATALAKKYNQGYGDPLRIRGDSAGGKKKKSSSEHVDTIRKSAASQSETRKKQIGGWMPDTGGRAADSSGNTPK